MAADVRILQADLADPAHAAAVLAMTRDYARDPMGDGADLPADRQAVLVERLRAHPTTLIFLAFAGDEPVAIVTCFVGFSTFAARPLVNIHDVHVTAAHRRRGLGRALLAAVEAKARELGCCKLTLEVQENNHVARALYRSLGFGGGQYEEAAGAVLFRQKKLALGMGAMEGGEMTELIVTTYDWVPEPPRGYVRDLRVCWALEEAGLPYRVESTPFRERSADHLAHQPFNQVPWLTDGDLVIFETGAILLHLGEKSAALMPTDPRGRSETIQWVFAALNSMEMATVAWSIFQFSGLTGDTPGWKQLDDFVKARVGHMELVLAKREWLAGAFSIADVLMADVLRLVGRFDGLAASPACRDYVARATARPAFVKAHAEQMARFAAAD